MDTKSFIESGLLEAYVLGQCTAEERAEVERMAAAHPEVRAELDAVERTLEKVAMANAVPPPEGLKAQIEQRIRAEARPGPSPGRSFRLTPALGWAACLLLGIALAWQYAENTRLQSLTMDCQSKLEEQSKTQKLIALLRDRNTRSIVLSDAPTPDVPAKVTATVWHNAARGETALDINSLPAPDAGKHFQFWAIVDGKPVSMGMVALHGPDSWQALPFVPNAQAFAISAEDKPQGNPTPTVVVMVGKV